MTRGKAKFELMLIAVSALGASGCGGRAVEDPLSPDADTPPPTCAEICTHVVRSCVGGADINPCTVDCEAAVTEYGHCPSKLDPYLRCMRNAEVQCHTGRVEIIGCDAERKAVQACPRP